MTIERVQLTFPHVGLGGLTESSLLALFGSAKLALMVPGDCSSEHAFVDAAGNALYPSYYATHLCVPAGCRLGEYRLWDRVDVGVEIRTSGGLFLDETYALGRAGEVPAGACGWPDLSGPSMRSGSLFSAERTDGEKVPGVPAAGCVTALEKVSVTPPLVAAYTRVQRRGCVVETFEGPLGASAPIEYGLVAGRDAAVGSHVLFSHLATIMDCAERSVFAGLWPPCPPELLDHASLLERETYYLSSCRAGQTLLLDVRGHAEATAFDAHGDNRNLISAGQFTLVFNVYERSQGRLVLTSRVRKLLVVPSGSNGLLRAAERFVLRYAAPSSD